MRFVSVLGALLFAYLAVIPFGLVISTLDSACAGAGCETSLPSKVVFTLLYGICLLALAGTAALFAAHAALVTGRSQERLVGGLLASAAIVAVVAFCLFFVAYPLGAVITLFIGATTYAGLRMFEQVGRRSSGR